MKRILYLHAGAEMYGADKVLLELIKGLNKQEFEAHVILPNKGVLVEVIEYPILRRKYFNPKGMIDYIRSYHRYAKKIATYAKQHRIDLVHNNTTAVLEGIYLKRKLKLPLLWHVHEIIVRPKFVSDFINMLMGRYADKIITVSEAVANHVLASRFVNKEKISVIYNGVDNASYYPKDNQSIREQFGIDQTSMVIGMIGRVNAWKGQNDFLDAVIPILKGNSNIVAFLAGSAFEGEEWRVQELDARIASLPVAEQIKRIDYYANTNELYNMFDIFVLPSTNPDPLPTVVLEAMACGKPIVGYRHGGVCEMVEEDINGLLAKPNDSEALSRLIQNLIDNPEKISEFGQASMKRQKEMFSLESYINNFSNQYEKLSE